MIKIQKLIMVCVLLCLSLNNLTQSGITTNVEKITSSGGLANDQFGYSVSISGDFALIGANQATRKMAGQGLAYIFVRSGSNWTQQAELIPNDAASNELFGNAVAISGNYAVIGAQRESTFGPDSGVVYVFTNNGNSWFQQAKLTPIDNASYDWFGYSVAISGDYIIAGAWYDDDRGSASGSAYIFKRDGENWVQEAKLIASDGQEHDFFGWSVAISGDFAIIGARGADDFGNYSGAAYIFKQTDNVWSEQAKLIASEGKDRDQFGWSVAISSDYAIVGATGNVDLGTNTGSAWLFQRDGETWNLAEKLTAENTSDDIRYGQSVAISRDYTVVGANLDNPSGSAYVYQRVDGVWSQLYILGSKEITKNAGFGWAVALSDFDLIVGVINDRIGVVNVGSSIIFPLSSIGMPTPTQTTRPFRPTKTPKLRFTTTQTLKPTKTPSQTLTATRVPRPTRTPTPTYTASQIYPQSETSTPTLADTQTSQPTETSSLPPTETQTP